MRSTLLLILAMLHAIPAAAECIVRSGPNTAALLELYTSEGCDSSPPADRWLSTFAAREPSPLVVPIAFHVDYWDYLGWKDRFANPEHSDRQRQLARILGSRSVFTPQVVLAGRDFAWRGSPAVRSFEPVNARPARADLEIRLDGGLAGRVVATLAPGVPSGHAVLHVAATQDGLVTHVKAGENRGETLRHDFVVRALTTWTAWAAGTPASIEARLDFAPAADWDIEHMRVVAFVQDVRTGEILQALAARACPR